MRENQFNSTYNTVSERRFIKTLDFVKQFVSPTDSILDLGPTNSLSKLMQENGFPNVTNTPMNVDLDLDFEIVKEDFDVVTSFEIFEHMVSPFPLIKAIKAKKMVVTVPLKLWFADAYWNENDKFDCHFHEFEPKQFDMLLEKAGWKIIKKEKWINKSFKKIGIRPFLRNITPRYYFVYCERI